MVIPLGNLATNPTSLAFTQFAAQPSTQPFTFRSGISYNGLLESIRDWILNDLIVFLNDNTGQAQWDANAAAVLAEVNAALTTQANTVNTNLTNAIQQVVNATILVTDPIMTGVLDSGTSTFKSQLDGFYGLTDAKLLAFFEAVNDGNPSAQVRAFLDSLYALTSQGILTATDTSGTSVFRNWLDSRYANATSSYWTPNWGGDTGARLGDNGSTNGTWTTFEGHIDASCQLIFGSSAVFGGSVLTGVNAVGGIDTRYALADGLYFPVGGTPVPVRGYGLSNSEMKIIVQTTNNGWVPIGQSGMANPPQSSTMQLHITGANPPA